MSRFLFEAINYYGEDVNDGNWGPFYCGMSSQLVLNEFSITLYGPTSTSKSIEIAQRFGTKDGIVIQLDNTRYRSQFVKSFCCSWISTYGAENEYLFGGNERNIPLIVETVIIQQTSLNFRKFFVPLFWFHYMLTNGKVEIRYLNIEANKFMKFTEIWNNLIYYKLGMIKNEIYPKYVHDTFHAFTSAMKEIRINLKYLNCNNDNDSWRELLKILFVNEQNIISNVISSRILRLFPSIESIRIEAYHGYEFDLLALLVEIGPYASLFQKNRLELFVDGYNIWNHHWLTSEIKNQYKKQQLTIEHDGYLKIDCT